ncbi:aminotransferase class III-fold pyridoxal phosphate-dependent enzyme [Spirillospora sp. NPDC050679]
MTRTETTPLRATASRVVRPEDCATRWGNEGLEVLSTPAILGDMERLCAEEMGRFLGPGQMSVGVTVTMNHRAAAPVGATVHYEVTTTAVDRRTEFAFTVRDEAGTVLCDGDHLRAVVGLERFRARLAASGKGGAVSAADAAAPAAPASRRPVAVRARGARVWDEHGREYIDGSSGAVCVNLGHGVPEVLAAMRAQAERITFVHRSQFAHHAVRDLSTEILAIAGPGYREVVFTNSGSEATETALRLALHHHAADPARAVVLTQFPSYHGMTAGALGVSGHPPRRRHLGALHDGSATTVPVASGDLGRLLPDLADWRAAFARTGPERIAVVLLEPVGGAASGACEVPDEVLRGLRDLCDSSGALLAVDEVMTGFGRTGRWFGHCRSGVTPDLVVTGKGLSAGYTPIGACLVGDRVLPGRSATDLAFGHTMGGNPLSAATALAVLAHTREHDLPGRAERTGAVLREGLAETAASVPFLGAPRGCGLLLALPVHQNPEGFARAPLAARICAAAERHGLIVYPAGVDHRFQAVLVTPPLTVDDADLRELLARLRAAVAEVDA